MLGSAEDHYPSFEPLRLSNCRASTADMTYTLHIANKRYSSWSMRPWVLLRALDIAFDEQIHIFGPGHPQPQFATFSPSSKVPCLTVQDAPASASAPASGFAVWDSLAICEFVAEGHPEVWPADRAARAFARCAAAEMHSGFSAIRDECGMNVALRVDLGTPSDAVVRDLVRLEALFVQGLTTFGGPWLAGAKFTAADAMFAPVATRYKTFGLHLNDSRAAAYLDRLYDHPAVQEWVKDGRSESARESGHEDDSIRGRTILEDFSASTQ